MSKFVTEKVNSINSAEEVEQLIIDDIKQLDVFEASLIGTTYGSEYKSMLRYVEHLANGNTLPDTKFKHLKGVTDGVTEYEFKSKHLRLYAIQQPNKKILICGGFKNSQDGDIGFFRTTKTLYLQSLKIKK